MPGLTLCCIAHRDARGARALLTELYTVFACLRVRL